MFTLKRYTLDLVNLLFPEICNGCGNSLYHGEKEICVKCLYDLPFTDFHEYQDNLVAKQFWGRIPLNAAMAMLYFKQESKVQNLIHALKYNNKTEVGIRLGEMLGSRLKEADFYQDIDLILPVPLHQKKLRLRGYNQSEYIANGMAEILGLNVNVDLLKRDIPTSSQTKKARYSRYENMLEVFSVSKNVDLSNKHMLLVDDVITTGATLEACARVLINSGAQKISIATIAFAE